MANEVIIKRGLKSQYTGLSEKNSDTIYFITDTGEIYVGDTLYSNANPDLSNYLTKDGENTITGTIDATTGTIKVNTPQNSSDATSKEYVDDKISTAISAVDAMTFKGTIGTGGTVIALPTDVKNGDTYKVITEGTYAGHVCEVGDLIIATKTTTSATDDDWVVVQANIDGAVTADFTPENVGKIPVIGSGNSLTPGTKSIEEIEQEIADSQTVWGTI